MHENKEKKILGYLKNNCYMNIAISYRDKPYATTLKYAAEKYELYVAIFKSSYTAQVLKRNNLIACTIENHNISEFVQIVGEAIDMDSTDERKKAGEILKATHENIRFWMYSEDVLFYKIRPNKIKYTLGNVNNKRTDMFGETYELIIKSR